MATSKTCSVIPTDHPYYRAPRQRTITSDIYNTLVVRDCHGLTLQGGWRPRILGAPELPSLSYDVAKDLLHYRLHKQEFGWPSCVEPPKHDDPSKPDKYCAAMRRLADYTEDEYQEVFDSMVDSLRISPTTLYSTFMYVNEDIFAEDFNFGRFVAFYMFATSLAIRCRQLRYDHLLPVFLEWISAYIDQELESQMKKNGGWDGFVKFAERKPKRSPSETSASSSSSSSSTRTSGIGAFSLLGLGSLLARISGGD